MRHTRTYWTLRALTLTLISTLSANAAAGEPDDRPWGRGTLMPSFDLGGAFSATEREGTLRIAGGLSYFVANNLGLGLSLHNFTTFLSPRLKSSYPGIEKQIPTNEFGVSLAVTVVLNRHRRFSPFISGGVGPAFLNHKRGIIGTWNVGPGVLIGIGRRAALNLGVNVSMLGPSAHCEDAYRYSEPNGADLRPRARRQRDPRPAGRLGAAGRTVA